MKNYLILFAISVFSLQSCTNDDIEPIITKEYYLNVQFDDVNLTSERDGRDERELNQDWTNCIASYSEVQLGSINPLYTGELYATSVGSIGTSEYMIDVQMLHFKYVDAFEAMINDDSFRSPYIQWTGFTSTDCAYSNMFFVRLITAEGRELYIDYYNQDPTHYLNIIAIELVEDNELESIYAYTGNFSVNFNKSSDKTRITVTGQFKFPVHVLH